MKLGRGESPLFVMFLFSAVVNPASPLHDATRTSHPTPPGSAHLRPSIAVLHRRVFLCRLKSVPPSSLLFALKVVDVRDDNPSRVPRARRVASALVAGPSVRADALHGGGVQDLGGRQGGEEASSSVDSSIRGWQEMEFSLSINQLN
jgi:hypothetical protein